MSDLRELTPRRLFGGLVILPLLLAAIYLYFFAADRYVSESTVALQRAGNDASPMPGAAMLLAGITPPSREDTLYLQQYIHSLGLLQRLESRLKLRPHYETPSKDFLFRLWPSSSQERFLDYYRSRIAITLDEAASTLTVRAEGFDASFAHTLNLAVLEESEKFVNELSHKQAREKLRFAEAEFTRASDRLQQAKLEVLDFQSKNKFLDPSVQAQASGTVTAELQASITKAEAELRSLSTFLNKDAFQLQMLRRQIEGLRAQMEAERTRATGSGKQSDRLGSLAIDFEGLRMKSEFALDAYKLSLGAVENARIEATRKLKSLAVIEAPTLPETAEHPRRLYILLTLLVISLLVYSVTRLVIATIREHQD